jgi:hypothetical protein
MRFSQFMKLEEFSECCTHPWGAQLRCPAIIHATGANPACTNLSCVFSYRER